MKKKIGLLIALTMVSLLLFGCGNRNFSIEGIWDVTTSDGLAGTIDFKENKTFILDLGGIFRFGGDYIFEDGTLTLKHGDYDPLNYEVEIIDNKTANFYSLDTEGNRDNKETMRMTRN